MKTKGFTLFLILSLLGFCASVLTVYAQSVPSTYAVEELENARKQIDYLQSALNLVRQYKASQSNEDVENLIQKIEVAVKQVQREASVDPMIARKLKADLDHDADQTQNFILVLAPIYCGIIFVMSFSTNKPKKTNPAYQAGLQNLRMAAIDFDVPDEKLIEIRNKVASIPRLIG